mmetsp:Transcript_92971/g.259853  ORF Transcript_92971/g.259853 Transcript_92971/m.259853 type:complete len:249 (+) Transcript_92971:856-1602(+)
MVYNAAAINPTSSIFRASDSASFADFKALSVPSLKDFSVALPSCSFFMTSIVWAAELCIKVDTSSTRQSPSSLYKARARWPAFRAMSYCSSFMLMSPTMRYAAASPAKSPLWEAIVCASSAVRAARPRSPEANSAEQSCRRAAASPLGSFASWKSSRASMAHRAALFGSPLPRKTSARSCRVDACSDRSSKSSKTLMASCTMRSALSKKPKRQATRLADRKAVARPRSSPASSYAYVALVAVRAALAK